MDCSLLRYTAPVETSSTKDADSMEAAKQARSDAQLKGACNDFEAVLTSLILKEGLKTAQETLNSDVDSERDNGCKQYNDMANEQMGMYIGKSGMMGLGNYLYNSIKSKYPVGGTK